MEGHIEGLLNRLSILLAAEVTICLLHISYFHSSSCSYTAAGGAHVTSFPSSTCDLPSSRDRVTPEKRFKKLVSSTAFIKRSRSFVPILETLRSLNLLSNSSRILVVTAGAGQDAFALKESASPTSPPSVSLTSCLWSRDRIHTIFLSLMECLTRVSVRGWIWRCFRGDSGRRWSGR